MPPLLNGVEGLLCFLFLKKMSRCAELMSCKCLRASPWKKSLKGLYPTQYSGYERDLEAQNAEELAKLALRNEKLFTPISK